MHGDNGHVHSSVRRKHVGQMRQRDGRAGLRATGDVPELRGRENSDQHVGPAAAVHTHPAAAAPLQFGSSGQRLEDSAADLLPTCGQVCLTLVPPPSANSLSTVRRGGVTAFSFFYYS